MRISSISLLFLALAYNSSAQSPPQTWSAGPLTFSGVLDGYFNYAPNHPSSHLNAYRNFDVRANRISLNMAKLTIEHEVDPVGFKLDLGYGRAMDLFHAQDIVNGFDAMRYVPQAYLSLRPKQWRGLQIDFGKFYTSAGAEQTETHLNWNYSRALLYANGPYYHFGFRAVMPVNKFFSAGFQVVNGWNNVKENNSGKTIGFTTALTAGKVAWSNNYYTGPEKTKTNEGFRNFYDTVVTVNPTDKLNSYLNFDYGSERLAGNKGSLEWLAVAGAARYQLTKAIAISPRVEAFYDKDGFITGTAQRLNEFTITGEYKWMTGLLTRVEFRRDWSDKKVFERGNVTNALKAQDTLLIGMVAWFGPKH